MQLCIFFCGYTYTDAGSIVVATLCVECNAMVESSSESSDRQCQDCLKTLDLGSQPKFMPFDTVEQNGATIQRTHSLSQSPSIA